MFVFFFLGDLWYLDTYKMKWYKVERKLEGEQRLWHSAVSIKGLLYVFGGCKSDILEHFGRRVSAKNEMFYLFSMSDCGSYSTRFYYVGIHKRNVCHWLHSWTAVEVNILFYIHFNIFFRSKLCFLFNRLCLNLVLKGKSKDLLRFLPPSVAKKANIEIGHHFPKIRTPFELLSL